MSMFCYIKQLEYKSILGVKSVKMGNVKFSVEEIAELILKWEAELKRKKQDNGTKEAKKVPSISSSKNRRELRSTCAIFAQVELLWGRHGRREQGLDERKSLNISFP